MLKRRPFTAGGGTGSLCKVAFGTGAGATVAFGTGAAAMGSLRTVASCAGAAALCTVSWWAFLVSEAPLSA